MRLSREGRFEVKCSEVTLEGLEGWRTWRWNAVERRQRMRDSQSRGQCE